MRNEKEGQNCFDITVQTNVLMDREYKFFIDIDHSYRKKFSTLAHISAESFKSDLKEDFDKNEKFNQKFSIER